MSDTLTPAVVGFVRAATHRFTTCWKITREDGLVQRFTEHNRRLTFKVSGEPFEFDYEPAGGFSSSARQKKAELEPSTIDQRGYLSTDAISHADLRAGLYRGAEVHEYLVDWEYPFFGPILTHRYFLQDVRFDGETWDGTLGGLISKLETQIGASYNRTCRYDLGDSGCTFDLNLVTVAEASINSPPTNRESFVGTPFNSTDHPNGHFDYGLITWLTGNNKDKTSEVRTYTHISGSDGQFVLQKPTAYDMQNGDVFDIYAGCDKVFATCRDKFGALSADHEENFGGFHLQPGRDRVQFPLR